MNLLEKNSEFSILEIRINPNNFIYKYKTEGMSPKDFSNDHNLLKNLRDGNINPKEVYKSN